MKNKVNAIILLSGLIFLSGCTQDQPIEKYNTSSEEFAELIGFSWWDIELPELSSNVHYGVCYKFEEEKIEPAAVMMSLTQEAPQKIRVYIRKHHAMRDYFEIYFVKNGTAQPFMIKNTFQGFAPEASGKSVSLGDPLVSEIITLENMPENYTSDYAPPALVFKTHINME
jgi:hypothetical protein